jgi:hypothetical protein
MMTNLLSRTVLMTPLLLGIASASAFAQTAASVFDPAQMPVTHGVVAQYDLGPRGDVSGLILTNGIEVHVPPYLGPQLLHDVKLGDSVTIHGLRARVIPLVQAMSVTDDKTGTTIADTSALGGPPPRPPGPPASQSVEIHDTVKMQLHGPRGELNGVLLANGIIVHMPPPAAMRLATLLTPGTAIAVVGDEVSSDRGQAIAANALGPANGALQAIVTPPFMGFGPNADAGAAPPPPPVGGPMGSPPAPPLPGGTPPRAP